MRRANAVGRKRQIVDDDVKQERGQRQRLHHTLRVAVFNNRPKQQVLVTVA